MRREKARPCWDDESTPRVRVLLECESTDSPSIIASVIERHGFAVRTCEGPRERRCRLLEDGVCELVDEADVVVNMLRSSPTGPRVLRAVAQTRRPPALVAVPLTTTTRDLIEGIRVALERRGAGRAGTS